MKDIGIESGYFKINEEIALYVKEYSNKDLFPNNIVIIIHGLGECIEYYDEIIPVFIQSNMRVLIYDQRGHGRSTQYGTEETVDVGDRAIYRMVDDLTMLITHLKSLNEQIPIYILGHSLGAIIALTYIYKGNQDINGLILTGPKAFMEEETLNNMMLLSKKEIALNGEKAASKEVFMHLFGRVNDRFMPIESELDWITRDKDMIKHAQGLPAYGQAFSNQFYYGFLEALYFLQDKFFQIKEIYSNIPILLLSGSEDPLTDFGEGIYSLHDALVKRGIADVYLKIYTGSRHSLLRDLNRFEVAKDIVHWIQDNLNKI